MRRTYEEGFRDGFDSFMKDFMKAKNDKKLMERIKRWTPSGSRTDPYKEGFKDGWKDARNGNMP